jgi:hypothetical protein
MTRAEVVQFRKQDFRVVVELSHKDETRCKEFADAIFRIRPSRLDNLLEIEVAHQPDQQVPQTIQYLCDHGVAALTVTTPYPLSHNPIATDSRSYMEFIYKIGTVVEQWTEMSRHEDEGDELMIDMLKVAFEKKMVSNCVWYDEASTPRLTIVARREVEQPV